LKTNPSAEKIGRGNIMVINRDNKSGVRLSPTDDNHQNKGKHFGKAKLKSAIKGKTAGRYLQSLEEDRSADRR
jgi:hypothetical protein